MNYFQPGKGLKPPSRQSEATSTDKLKPPPASSPKPAVEERKRDPKGATAEKSAEDEQKRDIKGAIPEKPAEDEETSAPFDPEMLKHLDMSTEEIGYKNVISWYFTYLINAFDCCKVLMIPLVLYCLMDTVTRNVNTCIIKVVK